MSVALVNAASFSSVCNLIFCFSPVNPTNLQIIFITGSSSGVGLVTAKAFFEKGWNVTATMCKPEGDIAIDAATSTFGKIDVVWNNAGYGQYGLLEMLPREKCRRQFDMNVFGVMDVTHAIISHLYLNKSGCTISVSTSTGLFELFEGSMYSSSKFALKGFTHILPYRGISETNLLQTAMAMVLAEPTLTPVYGEYIEKAMKKYQSMDVSGSVSAEEVANVIINAATDGTDKLRYLVRWDEHGFVKAHYESKSDEKSITYMRSFCNS
ncbi:short-chain alcohol dehydrogenase [Lepidopterella palustris CBS 459.81]|uniref:Short-chain alcohol dehydrogenase n=1 Tax=Lepidopterella palustris CBS 459.81 TaxID=1314670 RepID=A0A8E2EKG9_9PEZI|nr:short-chain alcohol dehydrogenase [Lepidopterella palustris CBS 459.81]